MEPAGRTALELFPIAGADFYQSHTLRLYAVWPSGHNCAIRVNPRRDASAGSEASSCGPGVDPSLGNGLRTFDGIPRRLISRP